MGGARLHSHVRPPWSYVGLGPAHDGQALTSGSLSAALTTVLAPETRTRSAAVAARIRTDGTSVAADLLAGLVSVGGGGRRAGVR